MLYTICTKGNDDHGTKQLLHTNLLLTVSLLLLILESMSTSTAERKMEDSRHKVGGSSKEAELRQ